MSEHPTNRPDHDRQLGSQGQPEDHAYGEPGGPLPLGDEPTEEHRWGHRPWDAPAYGQHPSWERPGHGAPAATPPRRSRPGAGFVAAVLAAALLVGGLAGLGGAAGFAQFTGMGEESGSSSDGSTTSSVIDREDQPAEKGSVQEVAESVLPSVVKINVRGAAGQGSGSGIILSSDGEILTNYHVVEVAAQGGQVSVQFNDGSAAEAEVVGVDPLTDLAVIKAQGISGLSPADLGQSGDLDVGERVVAIGSPFGLEATVTSGIVSALHRPVSISGQGSAINTAYPAIQTDAAINPGNSGGPLVNMSGDVVGVNSSIRTASNPMGQGGSIGLGFAIPMDNVLPIIEQLRNGEDPTHARLGVSVTDASSQDGLLNGAGITDVFDGSAADDAGLRPGDVVVEVDGIPVSDAASLVATIRGHRPGDRVALTVVRDGDRQTLEATLDSDQGQPLS